MKNSIKANLNTLHMSDIYSLMLFVMYKVQDVPDYAVLSELCYLLDGSNLTRLLAYFAGKTVKFPSEKEFAEMANALLLYQYINIDGEALPAALAKLDVTKKQEENITNLYLELLPIMKQYNVARGEIHDSTT